LLSEKAKAKQKNKETQSTMSLFSNFRTLLTVGLAMRRAGKALKGVLGGKAKEGKRPWFKRTERKKGWWWQRKRERGKLRKMHREPEI
jgi:hypothetical protein